MSHSPHRSRRRRSRTAAVRGLLEPLERRLLLAANLVLQNIRMINPSNVIVPEFTVGDRMFFRAEFRTTDLTPANSYIIRFTLDGVDLDTATFTGSPGVNVAMARVRGGWHATAGPHVLTVTLDALNSIAETNEADNSMGFNFSSALPVDLPEKFVLPLSGRQNEDWIVVNYLDVDPRAVVNADYQDGIYTYDDHNGIDLTEANFARMDLGLPVVAAAAGTVTVVADGNIDRNTSQAVVPSNYIQIDHGNGWSTVYHHFALNTTTVKVGEKVVEGQILGLAGSSGPSTQNHLHFEVQHNGTPVETFFAPGTFWHQPLMYQNSTAPRVLDSGTTNRTPTAAEIYEDVSDVLLFPTSQGGSIYYWIHFSHFRPTDTSNVAFVRPNLTTATSVNLTPPATPFREPYFLVSLPVSSIAGTPGTWQLVTTVNGVERDRKPFTITAGAGFPEIRLSQGLTYVIDGRTTPMEFGSIAQNASAPQMTFSVLNQGAAALDVTGISLPPGFSLVGALPPSLAVNATGSFMIQMDTLVVGAKFGTVRLVTNDPDETDFTFNVWGNITGTIPVGRPTLALSVPGIAYLPGAGPLAIDPAATVTDSNSLNFNAGNLLVEFAGNGVVTDVLSVASTGTTAGQISTNGNLVMYAGVVIGTSSGGTNLTPLQVALNSNATLPAVQALLRAITYHNTTSQPDIRRRYIRFTLTDDTGNVSNLLMKSVIINVFPYGKYTSVLTRSFYYRGSTFDAGGPNPHDNAIAPFRTALLPGLPASSTNISNYSRGINGLIIDIAGAGVFSPTDFILRVGNDNNPAAWALAPAATFAFRPLNGSTRIELSWPDNLIENQWLQLTILANANTKLAYDDVSYFGNAIGDTGDSTTNLRVTSADEIRARAHPGITGTAALIDNPFDFNRDGIVNAADQTIARTHTTTVFNATPFLHLLSPNQAAPFVAPLVMSAGETLQPFSSEVLLASALPDLEKSSILTLAATTRGAPTAALIKPPRLLVAARSVQNLRVAALTPTAATWAERSVTPRSTTFTPDDARHPLSKLWLF